MWLSADQLEKLVRSAQEARSALAELQKWQGESESSECGSPSWLRVRVRRLEEELSAADAQVRAKEAAVAVLQQQMAAKDRRITKLRG